MEAVLQKEERNDLSQVVELTYLTEENSVFTVHNGFISLCVTLENEEGKPCQTVYERVFLHRVFPFDMPDQYLSLIHI